jgi:hypothetical protein
LHRTRTAALLFSRSHGLGALFAPVNRRTLGVIAAMKSETAKSLAKGSVLCGLALFLGAPYVGLALGVNGPHDSVLVYVAMASGALIFVLGVILALISLLLSRNPT